MVKALFLFWITFRSRLFMVKTKTNLSKITANFLDVGGYYFKMSGVFCRPSQFFKMKGCTFKDQGGLFKIKITFIPAFS